MAPRSHSKWWRLILVVQTTTFCLESAAVRAGVQHDIHSAAAAIARWRQAERGAIAQLATHVVPAAPAEARASRVAHYAATVAFADTLCTANAANRACNEGRLLLNGQRVIGARRVVTGDALSLSPKPAALAADAGADECAEALKRLCVAFNTLSDEVQHAPALRVLYEDELMAIVVKPAGVHTVSWAGTERARVLAFDALQPLALAPPLSEPDALAAPLPVHRLDARVAGPVVVAKTHGARVALGRAFEPGGGAVKVYRALLQAREELGCAPAARALAADGRLRALEDGWLSLDHEVDGRAARTLVRRAAVTPCAVHGSLVDVELRLGTGRRHQLRRACEALGAPILGDDLFAGGLPPRRRIGLFLYCASIEVPHPQQGQPAVRVQLAEPPRFARHRLKARSGWEWLERRGRQAGPLDDEER